LPFEGAGGDDEALAACGVFLEREAGVADVNPGATEEARVSFSYDWYKSVSTTKELRGKGRRMRGRRGRQTKVLKRERYKEMQ
jgi:hypothetical protein